MQTIDTTKITRLEIIDCNGRSYVNKNVRKGGVTLSLQDENRTLKIFIDDKKGVSERLGRQIQGEMDS